MATLLLVFKILKTSEFAQWIDRLRDVKGRARILVRIQRLADGNPGDSRSIGEGIHELKIDFGPGYRVYFRNLERTVIILLAGGDKDSQDRDIKFAKEISRRIDGKESQR